MSEPCRVCGGYGFLAEKQFLDDGYGEVDSCPACHPPAASSTPREAELRDGWQPIETALKDGPLIDIWCSDGHDQWREPDCRWTDSRGGTWGNVRGFWSCATHWMAVPAPPAASRPTSASGSGSIGQTLGVIVSTEPPRQTYAETPRKFDVGSLTMMPGDAELLAAFKNAVKHVIEDLPSASSNRQPSASSDRPAWIKCRGCDDFVCTIHSGAHVYDCACPAIEEWNVDPYTSGGN